MTAPSVISSTSYNSSANSGSTSITVPTGTDLMLVCVGLWHWEGGGGYCYMDSYDNAFLDASGSGHPIQNLRDNLGYILALAAYVDLIVTQPQGGGGSPCATGYCLYGSENYICYQPNSGNFNLDLSGESGTFNVRKVNLPDGSINTAQTVDGGATRSITQPGGWTSGWACAVYK